MAEEAGPDRAGPPDDAANDDARTTSGDASAAAPSGLPCRVSSLLRERCQVCHGDPPRAAPVSLVNYDQLLRPAASDATRSLAEVALARMRAGTMPPNPPAITSLELQPFADWVEAGRPRENCASEVAPLDAGSVQPGPFDTPTVCTSGDMWREKDEEGPQMRPGGPCLACHRANDGPMFTIAGTVYASAHEPENCDGADDSDIRVVIRGADGRELSLRVNSAGNFYSEQVVALPFTAKVTIDGRERRMGPAQSSGDCNSCHTERGANGAPGRIMLP
jgi:mono/diheme cytochrome c family protein